MSYVAAAEAPMRNTGVVKLHGATDFEGMRRAGRLAAEALDFITPHVEPGVTTGRLDDLCHQYILDHDATPAPLNYRGFPKSICTSINHVVCHGIPGPVGVKARRLCEVTYEAMLRGIEAVRPGAAVGDIGHAIQSFAERHRCSVVRDFCGHGLGRLFHDAPNILHYGEPTQGLELRPGMFFTVEPMINLGRYQVKVLDDGWTAVTKDRSLSAQFEHSVGVTEDGHEIFTHSPAGLDHPPYA
jgi:methionyl aminopeptidase